MDQMEWQEKLRALSAGELTPQEQANLLREAKDSTEKTEELRFSRALTKVLQERDLFEVRGIVAGLLTEEGLPPRNGQDGIGKFWRNWGLGIVLVLSLFLGTYWVGETNGWWVDNNPKALAATYLQALENVVFVEESATPQVEELRLGMDAYDRQDYTNAIRHLKNYYDQTQDSNAGLFLAVSYLLKQQANAATPILLNGLQRSGPVEETSRWYLALAYLQREDVPAAIRTLEVIPIGSLYGIEARELLEMLK